MCIHSFTKIRHLVQKFLRKKSRKHVDMMNEYVTLQNKKTC
jgi:hypothetical protein